MRKVIFVAIFVENLEGMLDASKVQLRAWMSWWMISNSASPYGRPLLLMSMNIT